MVQRLTKQQRQAVKKYSLTSDFVGKHVVDRANRKNLVEVAARRGVAASTLVRAKPADIEKKALSICQSGDDSQVAAEDNPRFGKQIKVRMTGFERATINRGAFGGWGTEPFGIVGAWRGTDVEGNHFDADDTVPVNDEEVFG